MKTVLLTGFEPFGGDARNPSQAIAAQLDGAIIEGHQITSAILACEFGKSRRQLHKLIERHMPSLVVCLGLASGRQAITPERIAINLDDARIPDNAGRQPVDKPVVRGGPSSYWSTLPVKAITAVLTEHGIPAEVSHTAGTFVCNHVFYSLMHELAATPDVRGGFIHVPAPWNSPLSQDALLEGITLAVAAAIRHKRDIRITGGATH
ncbi:pyroglutamyl-peptidase I [Luteolibacter ambystomatis]|uniref:Pyrrolidone-carboxylate peptidase n=1 Tax=Luteolibacter ambystomatis TaxID=2824561 RepID=A0A975J189_9BACT|nr:pyroglutamyl-peptidase I [Luteolibacter ambystomatis]QUE52114.1 pyroglutamyl-peptidase I [Luteolibacter ambystomatis]